LPAPFGAGRADRVARSRCKALAAYQIALTFAKGDIVSDITTAQALEAVNAGIRKSVDLKLKMNVAVVDAGGNLKAFARMDGAWIGSIDISQKKARTARFFDMPTGEIGKLSQPGKPLYAIEVSNGGLITFPGGVPVKNSAGEVIGAVGVSGSTVENDHTVAEAAAAAIKA
jgi:uncharacterized protein GlcG (DUF336 family)